jgi:hypothetical protein
MPFTPKGYAFLTEVIRTIGDQKYGQDWIGGDPTDLRPPILPKNSRTALSLKHRRVTCLRYDQIAELMRTELGGTSPHFKDAVRAHVKRDSGGELENIPPPLWFDDDAAIEMLYTGRTNFYPQRYSRWFINGVWPDANAITGRVLLSESSVEELIVRIASRNTIMAAESGAVSTEREAKLQSTDDQHKSAGGVPSSPAIEPIPERPAGMSNTRWNRYLDARHTNGFPNKRGSISRAARRIAAAGSDEYQSVRRDLTRVLKALRKKN